MAKAHVLTPHEAVERGREYVEGYLERVKAKGLADDSAPALYRGRPYEVHCHAPDSGGLLLLLRRDAKGGFRHVARGELAAHAYDFSVYLSKSEASAGGAKARGASDADRDCSLVEALAGLDRARKEARSILESTEGLLKTNPWLDEYASSSMEASERLMKTIAEQAESLRREMDSLASSHRAAMTDLASGLAPAEGATAADDALLAQVRSRVSELEHEQDERWKRASGDFAVLSEVARRVDTVADELDAFKLKLSRELEESGGSKKTKETLKALSSRLEALELETSSLREGVKVSQEIRDTLFRDSKRLHNMNDRVNAIEERLDESKLAPRVAELGERLDALERRAAAEPGGAAKAAPTAGSHHAARDAKPHQDRRKR
jgi:hypothetical protein